MVSKMLNDQRIEYHISVKKDYFLHHKLLLQIIFTDNDQPTRGNIKFVSLSVVIKESK